jgi:hypothetical protein
MHYPHQRILHPPAMASFSSASSDFSFSSTSSIISITSPDSKTSREATPEFDLIDSYEALAPLHWDAEEWDFNICSEDDESLTDDEDLQILLNGIWMKATMIPGMTTSSFPQKNTPRTLQPTMTRQQEGSCTVDHRLQKTMRTPATTPVIAAMTAATAAATAAAAMAAATVMRVSPIQASQVLRDLLVVVCRVISHYV